MGQAIAVLVVIALLVGVVWFIFGGEMREEARLERLREQQIENDHQERLARDYNEALAAMVGATASAVGIAAMGLAIVAGLALGVYALIALLGTVVHAATSLATSTIALIADREPRTVNTYNQYLIQAPATLPQQENYLRLTEGVKYSLVRSGRKED